MTTASLARSRKVRGTAWSACQTAVQCSLPTASAQCPPVGRAHRIIAVSSLCGWCIMACPHCRRKVRLSPNSATVAVVVHWSLQLEVRSGDNRGYWNKFGSPWIRPRSPFSQIFTGLLFAWTLWIHLPNLKFVALRVHEIIVGGTQKIGQYLDTPTLPFLQNFYGLVFGWALWMYRANLQSVALAVPEIIAIAVLGWGCEPPI